MNEILTIHVLCTENRRIAGASGEAGMVFFEGTADSGNFRGRILSGGCDTQTHLGGVFTLSARYMLEGTDRAGQPCRIFIENNGSFTAPPADGVIETSPVILTDSPELRWMESARLKGRVSPEGENRVLIQIFAEAAE